jgi:hypothetical protein
VDSTVSNDNNEEPHISDDKTQNDFEKYMMHKERTVQMAKRRSSSNVLVEAPVLLINWKLLPPSFFKLKVSDEEQIQDYEYLQNPYGYKLSNNQKKFIEKFYADCKDPFAVMNWLYEKANNYQEEQSCIKIAAFT